MKTWKPHAAGEHAMATRRSCHMVERLFAESLSNEEVYVGCSWQMWLAVCCGEVVRSSRGVLAAGGLGRSGVSLMLRM